MITVLAFATPMELFFSEVWLIYEYQRDLMPLYVPVGHWFLFDLGRIWSEKLDSKYSFGLVMLLSPLVLYGFFCRNGYFSDFALHLLSYFHQVWTNAKPIRSDGLFPH